MNNINTRIIALTTKFYENKLIAIHALEIINYEMTGIYFHAYFNKDIKLAQDDMYYYSEYEYSDDKYYLENFKRFVDDSQVITYKDKKINELTEIKINDLTEITTTKKNDKDKNLIELAEDYNILVQKNSGGLVYCTVLGRIICKIYNPKKEIEIVGEKPMFTKSFEKRECSKMKEVSPKKKKLTNVSRQISNINKEERLIVIDTDTTGIDLKANSLIAIHAVEIIEGKLTGLFFHSFINRRSHNYDYMYYLASYNYCLEKKKKMTTFLNFIKNDTIVSHNIKFDIGFINKTLLELKFRTIKKEKCFCTVEALGQLLPYFGLNYKLKDCANFYNVKIKEGDFHKGIVDVVVLGRIVCKMVKNNDDCFNVNEYSKKYILINEQNMIENKKNKDEQNMIENKKNKDKNKKRKYEKNILGEFNKFYITKWGKKYHLKICGNTQNYITVDKNTLFTEYNLEICKKCANYFGIKIE